MTHAWFIYSNEVVSGPFTTEEVKERLSSGQLAAQSFIWWRGQREWVPSDAWLDRLPSLLETNHATEKAVWYVDMGAAPIGPLTRKELVQNLRNVSDLSRVKLWSVGMPAWVSLFEVHEVMEALGISRREYERAPLMGSVAVNRSTDSPKGFVMKANSISIGGMGLAGSHDLRRGDEVALLIKTNELPGNLHLRAEVVYTTSQGYVGLRFIKISAEAQSIILDYVKRFNSPAKRGQGAA